MTSKPIGPQRWSVLSWANEIDLHDNGLAIVISDFPLDWKGREGPTITLSKSEDEAFLEEAGYNGVSHITIQPFKAAADEELPAIKLEPDERLYDLTIYRGGLDAVGYTIVVRKIAGKWYIKQIEMSWIS